MVCVPTVSAAVAMIALPLLKVCAAPRFTPLSLNCSRPTGVPAPELTVAVNVTDCPMSDGFCDEARVTVGVTMAVSV